MTFTEYVHDSTVAYLNTTTKSERKMIGQFFTPVSIASFMGDLSTQSMGHVRILDPGAGSGILSAALIDRLVTQGVKSIELDMYENNEGILPILEANFSYMKAQLAKIGIELDYHVIDKNFIHDNQFVWTGLIVANPYDIVISNPPYKKIGKDDLEASIMKDIVYGQPNLYFLFMAMGAALLKDGGEFIYIVPRSFSSGMYFKSFRKWFLGTMKITNLHLFTSREAVAGNHDSVLQETIILKAIKTKMTQKYIHITESSDEFCATVCNQYKVAYETSIREDHNSFMFIPSCREEADVLDFVNQWPMTLVSLGYKMKTGLVVDFRETQYMRVEEGADTIPLLWPYNFDGYTLRFPVSVDGKPQYLQNSKESKRIQMEMGNYLLLKRFTSKEERRRLQCAFLFKDNFVQFQSISTENHLNFIAKRDGDDLKKEEMYGLFTVINSTYMDRYFRILNGSTQVNANEINAIPFPEMNDILCIGQIAMAQESLGDAVCDRILEEHFSRRVTSKAM